MLTLGSGSKLTFKEVLTVNNYKITFLSNIQILTFINISSCERIPFIILQTQSKLYSISSLQITGEVWINGFLVRFICMHNLHIFLNLYMLANSTFGNKFFAALPPPHPRCLVPRPNAWWKRERNVTGCVVFIIHIMVAFHSLTFIESNLQRREYHFVNS